MMVCAEMQQQVAFCLPMVLPLQQVRSSAAAASAPCVHLTRICHDAPVKGWVCTCIIDEKVITLCQINLGQSSWCQLPFV